MKEQDHSSKKELKKFGLILTGALLFWGFMLWKLGKYNTYPYFFAFSSLSCIASFTFPVILKPVRAALTAFTKAVNYVLTLLSLVLLFYCVITPIGFLKKIFGSESLTLRFKKGPETRTYWIPRDTTKQDDYEKQY